MTRHGDAAIVGVLSDEILDRRLEIAFGRNREDKHWKNIPGTVEQLLENLTTFERGPKDGRCLLQGALVDPQRLANNVSKLYTMMFDYDVGLTMDEVQSQIDAAGLWALLWTTASHLKDETEVPEGELITWLRDTGRVERGGTEVSDEHAIAYLREKKRIEAAVLEGAKVIGRELIKGGRKYRVKHNPLPRLRAMFLLDEPFDFATRPGLQRDAIEEWKKLYAGVSVKLGLPFDRTCVDPSRLMYTPRIPATAQIGLGLHEIRVIAGKTLDLSTITPMSPHGDVRGDNAPSSDDPRLAAFDGVGETRDKSTQFKTKNLAHFLAVAAKDFRAASWMEDRRPDDVRRRGGGKAGIDFKCPNESEHTPQEGPDTGFHVMDAQDNTEGTGFAMWCMHSCKEKSGGDRAWYLDKALEEWGIADALDLISPEWTPEVWKVQEAEKAKQKAAEETAAAPDALDKLIDGLSKDTESAELDAVMLAVSKLPSEFDIDRRVEQIVKKTGFKEKVVRKALKTEGKRSKVAGNRSPGGGGGESNRHNVPDDLNTVRVIWTDWDWQVVLAATKARLAQINKQTPRLFKRPEGGTVRIEQTNGRTQACALGPAQWAAELSEQVLYKEAVGDIEVGVQPPKAMPTILYGTARLGLPELVGITHVPVFSDHGDLNWTKGYDPNMKIYLDPDIEFEAVPAVLTPQHVAEAVWWLREAIRDFPFSDTMDGSEPLPVKLSTKDADGFYDPNWERGESSRTNCMAMVLQHFARCMIKGPCPAYHIDKSSPGTGAGYLADVVHIICEGTRAIAQTMSSENEEFRKAITATLRSGTGIIFVDNINRTVNSGDLAAALTTGVWRDRILGKTESVEIPIRATWIMAGNNLDFSHELMRRNVPIRLDAAVPNPAHDRTKNDFKHFPLQPWLIANRAKLVWACHVLIANWVDQGMKWGSATFHSFDDYAGVMSGIFDAAGVRGFLTNIPDYLSIRDEDAGGASEFAQECFNAYGFNEFEIEDMIDAARGTFGELSVEIPVTSKDEKGLSRAVGKYVKNQMAGKTYRLSAPKHMRPVACEGDVWSHVKLIVARTKRPRKYRFLALSEVQE